MKNGVRVGRVLVPVADVVAALADLHSPAAEADPADADSSLVVKLTDEEHRRLRVRAAEGDTSMAALVRNAMRAAGLI